MSKEKIAVDSAPFCRDLKAFIDDSSRILILGSMPGVASLKAQQFYAHPQNRFWPLLFSLLENAPVPDDYAARLALCRRHKIALWDSIDTCERVGSLDSAIKNIVPNDFPALFAHYPNIKTVIFNGGKAAAAFKKYHKNLLQNPDKKYFSLPSTSAANASYSFARLKAAWGKVLIEQIKKECQSLN